MNLLWLNLEIQWWKVGSSFCFSWDLRGNPMETGNLTFFSFLLSAPSVNCEQCKGPFEYSHRTWGLWKFNFMDQHCSDTGHLKRTDGDLATDTVVLCSCFVDKKIHVWWCHFFTCFYLKRLASIFQWRHPCWDFSWCMSLQATHSLHSLGYFDNVSHCVFYVQHSTFISHCIDVLMNSICCVHWHSSPWTCSYISTIMQFCKRATFDLYSTLNHFNVLEWQSFLYVYLKLLHTKIYSKLFISVYMKKGVCAIFAVSILLYGAHTL